MIHFYKYRLRYKTDREKANLINASREIKDALFETFGEENLREEPQVFEDSFSFSLHVSPSKGKKIAMGKGLKKVLKHSNQPYHFDRQPLVLYGMITPESPERKSVELIEEQSVKLDDQYIQRARGYYRRVSETINNENYRNELIENDRVVLSLYLETAAINDITNQSILWTSDEDVRFIRIEARHLRMTDAEYDEAAVKDELLIVEENASLFAVDRHLMENEADSNVVSLRDVLKVLKYEYLTDKEKINSIKTVLERHKIKPPIGTSGLKALLSKIGHGNDYIFSVRNVGQATATSISVKGDQYPLLYFDYGCASGRQGVRPIGISLPVRSDSGIILSHKHRDHWCGLNIEPKAFRCNWFVPDQSSLEFNTKIAEIMVAGGKVYLVDDDVDVSKFYITCGEHTSKPQYGMYCKHKTGLTMRINAYTHGKPVNLLASGDQIYEYIDDAQKKNLDVLVASHHGGRYYVRDHSLRRVYIPDANDNGMIIYSYGMGNKYNHPVPDFVNDHKAKGWINRHDTPSGDYELEITF